MPSDEVSKPWTGSVLYDDRWKIEDPITRRVLGLLWQIFERSGVFGIP